MSSVLARSLLKQNKNLVRFITNHKSLSILSNNNLQQKFLVDSSNKKTSKFLTIKQTQKFLYSTSSGDLSNDMHKRIDELVKKDSVVIFMKGTPEQPRCGFSKAVVDILKMHGVSFDAYNVLEDEELRSGIKEYSSWPTIPQVFFKGDFIGGCDILLEMHRSGELVEELEKIGVKSKLAEEENKS